jgi:hypothetical protein
MTDIPRIFASVPVYSAVSPLPFMSFLALSQQTGRDEVKGLYKTRWLCAGPKCKLPVARNSSCDLALRQNATHLCLIDDDMVPPPDSILRLLLHDVDIVAPLFFRSGEGHEPLVFRFDGNGAANPILDYPSASCFPVDAVGTGMMLIKRKVLQSIEPPWFFWPREGQGMDMEFCHRAGQAGFKIWCDSSIKVPQEGITPYVCEEDFLAKQEAVHA